MALMENPLLYSYSEIISWYVDKNGMTKEEISDHTGIPIRTLTNLFRKNASDKKHSLKLLVALAIGLKMTPEHAMQMINLNGHYLRDNKPIERYYKYLLSVGCFHCVAACNDMLVNEGFQSLTDNKNISIFE